MYLDTYCLVLRLGTRQVDTTYETIRTMPPPLYLTLLKCVPKVLPQTFGSALGSALRNPFDQRAGTNLAEWVGSRYLRQVIQIPGPNESTTSVAWLIGNQPKYLG